MRNEVESTAISTPMKEMNDCVCKIEVCSDRKPYEVRLNRHTTTRFYRTKHLLINSILLLRKTGNFIRL